MGLTEEKRVLKAKPSKVAVPRNENVIISFCVDFKKENKFSPFFPQRIIRPLST